MKLACSHRKRSLFDQTIIFGVAILISLLIDNHHVHASAPYESTQYPKLMFLAPAEKNSDYVLNEQDGFSGKVSKGWLIKADKEYSFHVHILTREQYNSIDDINAAYIYFTPEKSVCDASQHLPESDELRKAKEVKQNLIYKLDILADKSRFYANISRHKKEIRKYRQSDADLPSPSSQNSSKLHSVLKRRVSLFSSFSPGHVNTTYIVAKVNIRLKHHSSGSYHACIHMSKKLTNSQDDKPANLSSLRYVHQGDQNALNQIVTTKDLLPLFLVIIFYLVLTCFSALFSGLNLGLMSLDLTELKILQKVGSKKDKDYAKKIYPLRQKGNLLLCTILLGNVMVNSTSTLILGSYIQGVFAAIGSTLIIVIFGEILPQAACTRYGLAVGAYTRYITYSVMALTFVVSFPMGKILDLVLGKEIAVTYSRDKVRELMRQSEALDIKDQQKNLISGALDFKNKIVQHIMVPIKDVFSLEIDTVLDFETFKTILYNGYSRIPVYDTTKENLIGLILIQDLLLNDPADKVPLKAVLDYFKHQMPKCKRNDNLEVLFEKFRKGDTHMAFVYPEDADLNNCQGVMEAVGIVTLENIIEALIQGEIMDEADFKRERRRKRAKELIRGKLGNLSLSTENLNIFVTEDDQTNKPLISTQIRKALFYFLSSTVKPFGGEFVNPKLLETFLRNQDLIREKRNLANDENDDNMFLYKCGVECDYFTIIIEGKAIVQVGKEDDHELKISAGLFSYYGVNALISDDEHNGSDVIRNEHNRKKYCPEFSLYVDSYCVILQIKHLAWLDLIRMSEYNRSQRAASPTNFHSPMIESNLTAGSPVALTGSPAKLLTDQSPTTRPASDSINSNETGFNTKSQ